MEATSGIEPEYTDLQFHGAIEIIRLFFTPTHIYAVVSHCFLLFFTPNGAHGEDLDALVCSHFR